MSDLPPVLFLIFNRPDVTRKTFNRIRDAKPARLFIAGDGPRENRAGESDLCYRSRSIIEFIDWECDVKTLFRSENSGCGLAVSEAITWFFKQNEMGIILEDDCLPSLSFFRFCEILLRRYQDDEQVFSIGGTNIFERWNEKEKDYLFSYQGSIWGWATWRRAWEQYQYEIPLDVEKENWDAIRETSLSKKVFEARLHNFKNASELDTWDYQWIYTRLVNRGLTILPSRNLISNIGFGETATHTLDSNCYLGNLKAFDFDGPIRLRKQVALDEDFERAFTEKLYGNTSQGSKPRSLARRLLNRLTSLRGGKK